MSQQHTQAQLSNEGVHRSLEEAYAMWYDSKIAIHVPKPITAELAQFRRATTFQLTGYFEEVIMRIIAYHNYSYIEKKEAESQDSQLNDSTGNMAVEKNNSGSTVKYVSISGSPVPSHKVFNNYGGKYNSSAATGVIDGSTHANVSSIMQKFTQEVDKPLNLGSRECRA